MKSLFHDNRIATILQYFRKEPVVAVSTLALKLNVSERTVRNDIKQLNQQLRDCAVIEGQQGRYSLRVFAAERFRAVYAELMEADDFLNSSRNRMDYAFGKLMRSEVPMLTDELAYEMNVGRTTLVSDIKKLREELKPYDLEIVGKTSKGMMLRGAENNIRKYVLENTYHQLYREYPLDSEIVEAIAETFASYDFEKTVRESFEQSITLMLDRFLTGHYIGSLSDRYYNLTARKEYGMVNELIDRIGGILHVEFPVEEKLFTLLPIIGMRTPADIDSIPMIDLDETVRPAMQKIIEQIRQEMNITIESDSFTEEFLYHLMFMMNRLRYGIRLVNPILDDLKRKYPLAYQMAGVASRVIAREYDLKVTDDEKGYLASYFGVFLAEYELQSRKIFKVAVVCGTGRVTARLVAVQLKKILDSSVQMTLLADERVTTEQLNEYDIVLTTVQLSCECDRPTIRIHEIFDEQELRHKLEKARYWDQVDVPVIDNNWFVMAGLLDSSRFFVLKNDRSYDEAVAEMVDRLTEDGQLDEGFLERLRERERRGTMVFDHSVAIPHSVQYVSDRLVLSVGVFSHPIQYRDHEIRVIFLLGLPEDVDSDDGILIRVYDEMIRITQDEEMLDKIASADSFQALLRALYKQTGK